MKRKTARRNNRRKPLISRSARRRLTACLAAGAGAVAMGEGAYAAIVTTVDGSSTGLNGSIPIDFNQDSTPEFIISHSTSLPSGFFFPSDTLAVFAGPQGSNHAVLKSTPPGSGSLGFPAGLAAGAVVGPAGVFDPIGTASNAGAVLHSGKSILPYGNFQPGSGTQFLGLKWDFSGTTFFGWVQLTVNSPGTVDFYAFDDQGNAISTSDTGQPSGEVPEPGTLLLLVSGVAGLAALRKRNRKSAQT